MPISLDELNAKAAMLDREENKYLLTSEEFISLTDDLAVEFDILSIKGETVFNYRSSYFDTDDLLGYSYHHQGRTKHRFKIRTRHYVESGLCFFEVKLKNKRGGTIKKRIPYDIKDYGTITPEARTFLEKTYADIYGADFSYDLSSQMEVNYRRITLVAKAGGERMTLDFNLNFENDEYVTPVRSMIIAETKSGNGRGIADAIFKKHGIKSRSCSKYCLGANLLQYNVKYNRFKPLLKLYGTLPIYADKLPTHARKNNTLDRTRRSRPAPLVTQY